MGGKPTLWTERAELAANGRSIETEAAPIEYVAELISADADSDRTIRRLIALMVPCAGTGGGLFWSILLRLDCDIQAKHACRVVA